MRMSTCLVLAWHSLFTMAVAEEPLFPTIRVTGEHEIQVVPDRMILAFGIESTSKDVKQAVAENQKRVQSVTEYLQAKGLSAERIQTNIIQIYVLEEETRTSSKGSKDRQEQADPFGPPASLPDARVYPIIQGYRATRRLSAILTEPSQFETIYEGLIEAGINRFDSIQYSHSEQRKLQSDARIKAIQNAKIKATEMSSELGATLKSVRSIQEAGRGTSSGNPFAVDDIFASPTRTRPEDPSLGKIAIRSSVDVIFELGAIEIEN
jgi:uncharacterized protein